MNNLTKSALIYGVLAAVATSIAKPVLSYFDISSVSTILFTGTGIGTAALMIADFITARAGPEDRD